MGFIMEVYTAASNYRDLKVVVWFVFRAWGVGGVGSVCARI